MKSALNFGAGYSGVKDEKRTHILTHSKAFQPATQTISTNIYCFLILHVMVAFSTKTATNPMKTLLYLVAVEFISYALFLRCCLFVRCVLWLIFYTWFGLVRLSCAFLMRYSNLHSLMLSHSYSKLSAFIIHLYRNSCSQHSLFIFSSFSRINFSRSWCAQHEMCIALKWNNSKARHNLALHRRI